jgi:hypothetical protein
MKMKSEEIYGSVSLHKLSKTTMNMESTVPQQANASRHAIITIKTTREFAN